MIDPQHADDLLARAEEIHSAAAVIAAIDRVAAEIDRRLRHSVPLLLCVMNGGVPFAGALLTRLRFPLDFDFLQVGRYGQGTRGGELSWRVSPATSVAGRTVLVIDDILDQGVTLAAIHHRLRELGARESLTAVLADKRLEQAKPIAADFVALTVPNRF
ncbi:MAG TPA: hypoxanthine-guanine phosphoribosyltransferase, partial [Accumulibacter sp.]|nr:hypoxanthine-guanine phosphoribosyltransferase [Accumulibacter sp.]